MSEYIEKLEDKLNELKSELSSLRGKCSILNEQIVSSEKKIKELDVKKELYRKSVELLILVEQSAKEVIKKGFEEIVTYALQYILNSGDYCLSLEFGRRGNLQEVNFNLQTPDCNEPHDPLISSGGGVLDILSLALRVSLLELTKPKIEGFLILDEPFKHLSTNYLESASKFIKVINNRINRQIIMVTHKKELVIDSNNNIEIKQ
jgi:DNA repair exonuclease SbcCD ATPase subunit